MSDVVANVRADLASGVQRVLVATTTEGALRTVEKQLIDAGLLIPPRVTLVLSDEGVAAVEAWGQPQHVGHDHESVTSGTA